MHANGTHAGRCLVQASELCLSGLPLRNGVGSLHSWYTVILWFSALFDSDLALRWRKLAETPFARRNGELRFLIKTIVDPVWAAVIVLDGLV